MKRAPIAILLLAAASARAGNIQVPSVSLPGSEPSAPALLFPASAIPTLVARTTDSNYATDYAQVIGAVDPHLAALASNPAGLGDDTLCMIAKGAALLYVVGRAPPASFSSYRDAAVAALKHVLTRNPVSATNLILGTNPANPIDDLQDSPRFQSMLEAYDMLRGSGVASADDSAIRTTLTAWGEALRNDVNLTGAFGVGGHRDNWGIKAGSALVSAALELSTSSKASLWLSFGMTLVNGSLAATASDTGWYRESPHYLNYSLDNLVSTAAHVLNRTGVDWHPAMKPFVQLSLAMHQPDGLMAPFEEGVANVFPYDVLAGAYPDLAPQMMWAWQHANPSFQPIDVNYENQALHAATRFVLDVVVAAAAQSGPSTQFIGPDAHVHVLRSDWSAAALQATMITAVDDSNSTLNTTRHNMQNPMDMTVFGAGQMLLATSSGGPQVTTSANRSYYLLPSSKNVPLVSGTAPFITDGTQISSFNRLDARDDQGRSNHFLDTAHTAVTAYSGAGSVDRLLAMIDDSYVVVADAASGGSNIDFTIPWHGRGTYSNVATSANSIQSRWLFSGSALDLWSMGATALAPQTQAGYYASAFGSEEAVTGLWLEQHAAAPRLLTVLQTRAAGATPMVVQSLATAPGAAAATVNTGSATDTLLSSAGGTSITAGALASDCAFAAIREQSSTLVSFAASGATGLAWNGQMVLAASAPLTLSATLASGGLVLSLSADQTTPVSFSLTNLPGLDLVHTRFTAQQNDAALGAPGFTQSGGALVFTNLTGPSTLAITPAAAPSISAAGPWQVAEGQTLSFTVSGSEAGGPALSYSLSSTPALPTSPAPVFDASTGSFSWTPGYDVASAGANAIFAVTFTVSDGVASTSTTSTITVTDTVVCASDDADCDGVADALDPAPCDPTITSAIYYPAEHDFGMVQYEDQWPANGDLDFNDASAAYHYEFLRGADGRIVGVEATFAVLSIGAALHNGLYLHLPIAAGAIGAASLSVGGAAAAPVQALQSLGGVAVSDAIFQLADDTRSLFGNSSGYINTEASLPAEDGAGLVLAIRFATPLADSSAGLDHTGAPFDLFLARTGDERHQIHLAQFDGSATAADPALFGTLDDGSNRDLRPSGADNLGRHFVNASGLPFALDIPALVAWPFERHAIDGLYPEIDTFASSAGASDPDYYLHPDSSLAWQSSAGGTPPAPPAPGLPAAPLFSSGGSSCVGH